MHPMVLLGILLSCLVFCSKLVLEMLDRLQKKICRTVGPSLAEFSWTLGSSSKYSQLISFSYYFVRCSSQLAQLVSLLYSWERSVCYSDRLHKFPVTISRCYEYIYVTRFFLAQPDPGILCLWNVFWAMIFMALSPELKAPFICRFFLNRFLVCFNLFVLLFVVTPSLVVAVQLCMEWITINDNKEVLYLNLNLDPFFSYFI